MCWHHHCILYFLVIKHCSVLLIKLASGSKETEPTQQTLLNRKENKNRYQIIPLCLSFLFTSLMLYQSVSHLKPHDCFTVTSPHCYTNTLTQPFLRGISHLCWWHSSREETEWTVMSTDIFKRQLKGHLNWLSKLFNDMCDVSPKTQDIYC